MLPLSSSSVIAVGDPASFWRSPGHEGIEHLRLAKSLFVRTESGSDRSRPALLIADALQRLIRIADADL